MIDVLWIAVLALLLQSPDDADAPLIDPLALQEEWALRDLWQRPERVIEVLELRGGETVADLGAGKGYFTHRLARAVGPAGRVLALDVNPRALAVNREMCAFFGVDNVEFRTVPHADANLLPVEADLVFVSRTWHLFQDRIRYASMLRSKLPTAGKLAVVGTQRRSAPTPVNFTNPYEIRREAEAAGFVLEQAHDVSSREQVLIFTPGRASVFGDVADFHYVTSELAIGSGVPDSSVVRMLTARGFLTLIDVRQLVSASDLRPEGTVPGNEQQDDLNWVRLEPREPDFLLALCAEIDDPKSGIAYVFAETVDTVVQHLLAAHRNKLLLLTEFEEDLLRAVLDP